MNTSGSEDIMPRSTGSLQEVIDNPIVKQGIKKGQFSIIENGKPKNPKAHVWITDARGVEAMRLIPDNPYLKNKIQSVWVDEY